MFIREKKNSSGSVSIQIISKARGRYKVVKTVGCGAERHKIEELKKMAEQEINRLKNQPSLFQSDTDNLVEKVFNSLTNSQIRTIGPELIFGKIFDFIGFNAIKEPLFRHLVIARLAYPLSKLKTTEYLYRFQGTSIGTDKIYYFLDRLNSRHKKQVEQISFAYTKRILKDEISVVFYDMTTLYFEASDEDDLRKAGFSKDGKHSKPQIVIGLLVGLGGYAIGYDIFEGNTYEGHTLIPFLEKMQEKFDIKRPVVVADSGILSNDNLQALEEGGYQYIIGARLKNESKSIQQQIITQKYHQGSIYRFNKQVKVNDKTRMRRLIVHFSEERARKDAYNRKKGLERLEKRLKSGKLTKSNINNRGYNKYLEIKGDVDISIDYQKYENDSLWDGLKGYITNSELPPTLVLENYGQLWHIEKAFRMSKTDLRIRPIYHRLKHRIKAHICIAFTAYTIYKELERILKEEQSDLSIQKASEITHNMYQLTYQLPDSGKTKTQLLNMDQQQKELYEIITRNF
ncbi:MAG: IS1634 family transposase [Bacteroidales bacterium]|nr:IS1634 family transposase [Bacteroidales bacterium]